MWKNFGEVVNTNEEVRGNKCYPHSFNYATGDGEGYHKTRHTSQTMIIAGIQWTENGKKNKDCKHLKWCKMKLLTDLKTLSFLLKMQTVANKSDRLTFKFFICFPLSKQSCFQFSSAYLSSLSHEHNLLSQLPFFNAKKMHFLQITFIHIWH